jgi:hypothetical protein
MTPSNVDALGGRLSSQVGFRTRKSDEAPETDGEHAERGPLAALPTLAVILVLPPGLTPISSVANQPSVPPPPVHVADNGNPSPESGGGQVGGGSNPQTSPEPASLLLALTGSGAAALVVLVRRRRRMAATQPL